MITNEYGERVKTFTVDFPNAYQDFELIFTIADNGDYEDKDDESGIFINQRIEGSSADMNVSISLPEDSLSPKFLRELADRLEGEIAIFKLDVKKASKEEHEND